MPLPFDNCIIFDLEYGDQLVAMPSGRVPSIFEIGAIKRLNGIKTETFQRDVRPKNSGDITTRIEQIVGKSRETICNYQLSFVEAIQQFEKFCGNLPLFSWGTSDPFILRFWKSQCVNNVWEFGNCIDAYSYISATVPTPPGLRKAAEKCGFQLSETHSALYDAMLLEAVLKANQLDQDSFQESDFVPEVV